MVAIAAVLFVQCHFFNFELDGDRARSTTSGRLDGLQCWIGRKGKQRNEDLLFDCGSDAHR